MAIVLFYLYYQTTIFLVFNTFTLHLSLLMDVTLNMVHAKNVWSHFLHHNLTKGQHVDVFVYLRIAYICE